MGNNKNRRNQQQQNQQQNQQQPNNQQPNSWAPNNQQPKSWQPNNQQPNDWHPSKQQPNYQAQNGQNGPKNDNGSYISPNYKGKKPNGGYKYNPTNEYHNQPAGQQVQKQNDKSYSKLDPQQQELHASWLKQQYDQKRKLEIETAELLQKEQKDFLARSFTPSAETILALQTLKEMFHMQMTRDLSPSELDHKLKAFNAMQSHFNQQPHKDETIQQLLSTLLGYMWTYPTAVITDSALINRLWTTISDLITKMASSMSQHGDGGLEPLSRVLNDLQPPKVPSPTKQPEPANQTYQTNVHVDDLLNNYDAWLRQNGLSAIRVTSDTVYYRYLCATTEEEKKKERRFVDIAGHPGYVGLEGHNNINNDAAILRAAEHAFIVWTAQNQAAQALSRAKEAQKRVLQNVARVHPEARKKLEMFESGLEAERLRMIHREMQAQLDFEKHQKQQMQKLNERLEQQRREFLGMYAGEVKPTERAYLHPTIASLTPAGVNYALKPDFASQLFSGIKSPVKPAALTMPIAVKKPQEEKKESFYPRFMHAAQLFRVEKYGGDPTVGGHLQKDSEGQVVHFRPWKAPCVPGCRECVQYEQSDVL